MTQTAVLLVRPQTRGRQSASYHRGGYAIEGRTHGESPPPTDNSKVKCRKAGEKSPMTRILVARGLYEPSSLFCQQCTNNARCSNKT